MLTRATTTTLLHDLGDPANQHVWIEFDGRFRPILHALGRRMGLADADAADAAQESLAEFVRAYRQGKYDRDRGRLSSWLIGIARHCIADIYEQRDGARAVAGQSAIDALPDDQHMSMIWDEECRREILHRALQQLREETRTSPQTLEAFELVAIQQQSPAQAALQLGVEVNDIYLAKHRCLKRLRAIIAEMTIAFEVGA